MRPLHVKIAAALALAELPFVVLAALAWGRLPPSWLAALAPAALIALVVAGLWIARATPLHCDSVRLREAEAARQDAQRLLVEAGAEASSLRDALGRVLLGMRELRTGEQAEDLGRIRSALQALGAAVAQNDAQAQQAHRLVQEAEKRAGEHGRGFAVVAAEVRSLAARSAGSAKEIKHLVQNSARYVKEGEALVEASGEALAELMAAVKKAEEIVAAIAAASKAQSSGIEDVAQALSRVEGALQRNAGLVEESEGTARSLAGRPDALGRPLEA